ncbi:ParA family protein [Streptomyces antibioticus]|uniref:ParA family protein n=1 Tax=Streptomyces antibioticus TaxID=1890 RepID=UPI0033E37438
MASAHLDVLINQKGGVGKSTLTVNIAAVVAENLGAVPDGNSPVVAVGIDPQGSTEKWAERVEEDALPFDYMAASEDPGAVAELKQDPEVRRILADCPGFLDVNGNASTRDPLGAGPAADALRAILDVADRAIVPMTTEFLSREPTEYTIERVLKPRGIPFVVVVNLWDPRDGTDDRDETFRWIDRHGYPRAPHAIRRYKIHTHAAESGTVVTRYKESGTAYRAREDFYRLALHLNGAA